MKHSLKNAAVHCIRPFRRPKFRSRLTRTIHLTRGVNTQGVLARISRRREPAGSLLSHSSILQKTGDVVVRQPLTSAKVCKLDQDRDPRHLPAEAFHEFGRCRRRATGRQHVVDDQHPLPGRSASAWISTVFVPYSRA